MGFDITTAKPVNQGGFDIGTAQDATPEIQQKEAIKKDEGLLSAIDNAARNNPILQGLAEFQGGVNTGVLGLVDFLTTDQINSVLEISGSDKRVPSIQSQFEGAPEVEGGFMDDGLAKDVVRGAGQVAPLALSTGAAFRGAASSLPKVSAGESAFTGMAREMGKVTPLQDVVFGGASGAGGEVGQELGGDVGRTVGSLVAPIGVGVGGAALKQGANVAKVASQDIPEDLADAFSRGQVLTSDVMPPKTFIGKSLQRLGERVPYIGTGKVRANQQVGREQAVKDFAADFDVTPDAPFEQEIVGAANTIFKNSRKRATTLRKAAVEELNTGGGVNTLNTREAIAEEIARQKALGSRADENLIASLNDIQSSLEGNFGHVANIRTSVLNEIADVGRLKSPIASGGDASLEKVRAALTRDLNNSAEEFSKNATTREASQAASKWKASNRLFADGFSKARETELKKIFTKGEVTPEVVSSIVRGGKRSELKRLFDASGKEGREATRKLIIQDSIERSGGFENVNPTTLLNKLNQKNTRTATNMFFTGSAKRELDGFKKYLDLTRRAQEANFASPTGQEAVAGGAAIASFAAPKIAIPILATTAGGARVFESGTVRNLMIKLNAAKTQSEINRLTNMINSVIAEQASNVQQEEQEQN